VSNWATRDGKPAGWRAERGVLHVVPGSGDIMTTERFTDFFLHLEFRCPDMPEATGQAKGNSGVCFLSAPRPSLIADAARSVGSKD